MFQPCEFIAVFTAEESSGHMAEKKAMDLSKAQEAKPKPDIITYNDNSVIDACAKSGAIEKCGDAEKKSGDEEKASPSGIISHSAFVNAREESGDMEKARRKRKRNWRSSSFSSSSPEFYRDLSKSDDDLDFI